jgi:hypothetical protein
MAEFEMRAREIPFRIATPIVPQPKTLNTGRFDELKVILI